jgi:hypothetical protein
MKATQTLTVAEYGPEDVPEHLAKYADAEGLIIEATVWADMELDHYGVAGSPVWYSPNVTDVDIEVNGVGFTKCPADLYELAAEAAIERGDWEE